MRDRDDKATPTEPRGLIRTGMGWVFSVVSLLSVSLLISIIGEWIGMTYWWKEEGLNHSALLLDNELSFLNQHFKRAFYSDVSSAQIAKNLADQVQQMLYVESGWNHWRNRLIRPALAIEPSFLSALKSSYQAIEAYLFAMVNCIQVFVVRLFVIALSTPAYLLFGFAALVDGLVQRDLRRYGGGIERAFVYHKCKALLKPGVVLLPALFYLALPVTLNPGLVFIPAAAFFSLTLFMLATTFKKYL